MKVRDCLLELREKGHIFALTFLEGTMGYRQLGVCGRLELNN